MADDINISTSKLTVHIDAKAGYSDDEPMGSIGKKFNCDRYQIMKDMDELRNQLLLNSINDLKENMNENDNYQVIHQMDATRNELLLSPRYKEGISLYERKRKLFDFEYHEYAQPINADETSMIINIIVA